MGYIQKMYIYPNSIEVEKVFSSRYGKRCVRGKNENPSPADVEKVNLRNAIKAVYRLMKNNFTSNDYHFVLTHNKDSRPMPDEAKRILRNFKARVKREYAKEGVEFKWMETTEYKNKAIHHHMVINECNGKAIQIIKRQWKCGHVRCAPLWEDEDYEGLAAYLIKETAKTRKEPDSVNKQIISHSRNLKPPKCIIKIIPARVWRKNPKPLKGYYIDKSSLYEKTDEVTGYIFQYYTMIRVERRQE